MELKSYNDSDIVEVLKRIKITVEDFESMEWKTGKKIVCEKLNERFKEIKTFPEFQQFMNDMCAFGLGFKIFGKRRSYRVFDFRYVKNDYFGHPYDFDRVSYLYDDSVSTGESYVKNLYKYLKIIE